MTPRIYFVMNPQARKHDVIFSSLMYSAGKWTNRFYTGSNWKAEVSERRKTTESGPGKLVSWQLPFHSFLNPERLLTSQPSKNPKFDLYNGGGRERSLTPSFFFSTWNDNFSYLDPDGKFHDKCVSWRRFFTFNVQIERTVLVRFADFSFGPRSSLDGPHLPLSNRSPRHSLPHHFRRPFLSQVIFSYLVYCLSRNWLGKRFFFSAGTKTMTSCVRCSTIISCDRFKPLKNLISLLTIGFSFFWRLTLQEKK